MTAIQAILPLVALESVLQQYDAGRITAPPRPEGGTANLNLGLETTEGRYFLKRRNPKYAHREFVAYDHRLMEHLAPFALGTPLAVRTRFGQRWLEWEGAVYELYPYQDGEAHDPSSRAQLTAAGKRLAEFHQASRTLHTLERKRWPRYNDPARIREGIREIDGSLRQRLSAADYDYLRRLVEMLEREYPDSRYDALPRTVVHGDYHPGNLKFSGDTVAGVFDLDWATEQPRLLDLADGVFLFAGVRQTAIDSTDIISLTQTWMPSQHRTRAFMEGYLKEDTITPQEWALLPWAVCARWLFCRIAGRLKLPPDQQTAYVVDGFVEPLRALEAMQNWDFPGK